MKVMGIDEAGRGAMFGPLVIGYVLVTPQELRKLRDIGVKDSKKLSPNRRYSMHWQIKAIVSNYMIQIIKPSTVDYYVHEHGLNKLELKYASMIVKSFKPKVVYVDSLLSPLRKNVSCLVRKVLHGDHTAINAASVLAKVIRDKEIGQLQRWEKAKLGSGYPSDPISKRYLRTYIKKYGKAPLFARQTWKPVRKFLHPM